MDVKETLFKLCKARGVSGREGEIAELLKSILAEYSHSVCLSPLGSVVAKISEPCDGYPTIMLEAHLDEVGLVVTSITDEGFLKVDKCGGVDASLLVAQEVVVCGKRDLPGVVCSIPPHLAANKKETAPTIDDIYIDVGMERGAVEDLVEIGNVVSYAFRPKCLKNGRVSVKSLDNRAGVMAVLLAIDNLKSSQNKCGVEAVFSSLEETSGKGATTCGYLVNPDFAICVDVSFAKALGCPGDKCGEMGRGAMIGIAPTLDYDLSLKLRKIAESKNIPYQLEIMNGLTSTDADKICVARAGIKTGLCSIPLKYMHSPVEMVDLCDIDSAAKILENFVISCEEGLS